MKSRMTLSVGGVTATLLYRWRSDASEQRVDPTIRSYFIAGDTEQRTLRGFFGSVFVASIWGYMHLRPTAQLSLVKDLLLKRV